jgi:FtsP/CotA-like multicopper oxidase with cupredoxin domain
MTTNATRGTTTGKGRRLGHVDRRLLAGLVTVVAVAAAFLAQAALAGPPAPNVPDGIQPPAGNKPFLVGHGVGVQIYACDGVAWSFVAPRANLFADNGRLIISHFAGPSWQARDGSTVVGTVVNKATLDRTAIQWLLLSASPAPGSKPGRLDQTTFIQRVNTTGGLAPPASECTAATAGTQAEVPYTADYYFWK